MQGAVRRSCEVAVFKRHDVPLGYLLFTATGFFLAATRSGRGEGGCLEKIGITININKLAFAGLEMVVCFVIA